ncbi:mitochondrial ribosomal protein L37 [Nomia melanderi]|uniref:mitochondrial ribosomal protein L37 n=1 Tax=Nomia melanderi TaxID=2448451 RepID=UPI00130452AF|nr:39S ribosomal protein L37, mitochondrial [Nomia melanderi]XP_031846250.1 39S ribosomal protein L37, mitochondrial [Nomia melanderi]XP_031846251.1 39S ribosomal protein L37, mitochondrial [Nomia melanderi]XP_031846252.1 39S ribosomal protein L37, mitochondrial [Nomia melanderi]XP_031846253.1 39S ribosomal protein L37, mitochondrial [Nomia melanderi]XP_031846254.1 39S ribosomal protein L37, mitochondrial [Nomia melanderi]XP_031846255.1 39S ribosomal protein L37, mitochondrial [Nomia melander
MKFTQVLYKQHLGRAIRLLWQLQRERNIIITKAEETLTSMSVEIQDATEVAKLPKIFQKLDLPPLPCADPNWKEKSCLIFNEHNLLQEGIPQACLLTKTLKIDDELPIRIIDLVTNVPEHVDNLVKRIVNTSTIYDAYQKTLPKLKDPNRPSWVFPRQYGITSTRKMHNITYKFLQLCESLCGFNIVQNRSVIRDSPLSICIDNGPDLLKFSFSMDLITSLLPLAPIADVNTNKDQDMPNIYPLHYTIGLTETNSYDTVDICPFTTNSKIRNIHTIFVNHDPERVKNITELPVMEHQIHARSLLASFTAATVYARQRFGLDIKELAEPVVIQCIQSDGQHFHFSVYQLNTLDINGMQGIKNFWWTAPTLKLYENAGYKDGKPCCEGYNNEVFKRFVAFYKNT